MSFNGSFTREKRKITVPQEEMPQPGPQTYNTMSSFEKLYNVKGAGTIGKSRKGVDFTLVHPQFKPQIVKGLL